VGEVLPADPDKAIEKVEKDTQAIHKKAQENILRRRRKLVDHLRRLEASLRKAGKVKEADAVRDRLTLVEAVWAGNANPTVSFKALKAASVSGKYRHLLRVLHVPGDLANYKEFSDYGPYNGNAYAGYNDLPAGYWVYVHPNWFIWRDKP
jgi:hypothetical protein